MLPRSAGVKQSSGYLIPYSFRYSLQGVFLPLWAARPRAPTLKAVREASADDRRRRARNAQ